MHSADKLIEQVVRGEDPAKLVEDNEWALQFTDTSKSEEEANQQLKALKLQDGYIGGRVLPPSGSKPGWRVQAFFIDEPEAKGVLPDGMRRVILPAGQKKALGIGESLTEDVPDVTIEELRAGLQSLDTVNYRLKSALIDLGFIGRSVNGHSIVNKNGKFAASLDDEDLKHAIAEIKKLEGTSHRSGSLMHLDGSHEEAVLRDLGWITRGGTYNRLHVTKAGIAAIELL